MTENSKKPSEPKRLGRGLSSLLGEVPIAPATSENNANMPTGTPTGTPDKAARANNIRSGDQVRSLPIEWINPGPWQPRQMFEANALAELAVSIRQRGLIQPILVRENPKKPSRYELIAGERRWRAAQLAKLHEIPAIISDLSDKEAGELSLIENIQRHDLSIIEEAEGYKRLIEEFKYTQDALATVIGKSRSHLANTMRLLNLPDQVRGLLSDGALSAGQVRPLVGRDDAVELAQIVLAKSLSARQVEQLVAKADKPVVEKTEKPSDIIALERELAASTGFDIAVSFNPLHEKGSVTIRANDLDQFDAIIAKLKK